MIGIRTPLKKTNDEKSPQKPKTSPPSVRRSVGEWEATKHTSTNPPPPLTTKTTQAGPAKVGPKESQEAKTLPMRSKQTEVQTTPPKLQYADRSTEARACLNKAKLHLSGSRNTKTEIKTGIIEALERLYQLVKEAEGVAKTKKAGIKENLESVTAATDATFSVNIEQNLLAARIEEHSKLLLESNKRMEDLKAVMERNITPTYANVTAIHGGKSNQTRSTLHSIVVTSKDDTETGDEVLDKIRNAVDAKEGWVKVERVRKAKDSKIIMGFQTREERNKVKSRLEEKRQDLSVEEMRNKDPLLILRGVFSVNSDEEVLRALRNQNRDVFRDLDKEEDRVEVKYRRRTRNPHAAHVVVSVSPIIWRRAIELGRLHVELQRVRVEDQTPLVQCTRCLGYGHGRRFCKVPADLCSHCGGPHLKSECGDCLAGVPPKCQNCTRARLDGADHNAFSPDCPTRHKWDEIARSTVAYC